MKYTVHVDWANRQSRYRLGVPLRDLLQRSICAALSHERFYTNAMVSVTFTDNQGIQELNRRYRGKDAPTDVLSFPMYAMTAEDHPNPDEEMAELGDVVLSLERVEEQAKAFGHSFERECAFLTVHSILHLLGYDHERSLEEEKKMFRRQEEIMEKLGLPREK